MNSAELVAYASRLRTWNDSPKYAAELRFLYRLLDPSPGERILDVGCGLGRCVAYLVEHSEAEIEGFDVNHLVEGAPGWYRRTLADAGRYDKIYLLHSLAHIPDPQALLTQLVVEHLAPGGRLYVLTPNAEYGRYMASQPHAKAYVPDETVQRHYTLDELTALLAASRLEVTLAGYAGKREGPHHERLFAVAVRAVDDHEHAWTRTFPGTSRQ